MKTIVENLIYGHNENIYVKSFVYVPDDLKLKQYGEIYAFFMMQEDKNFSEDVYYTICETIKDMFYVNIERDVYESFESTLKEVNDILFQFTQKKGSNIDPFDAVIMVKNGNNAFITNTGNAECYIFRNNTISLILDNRGDVNKPYEYFINIAQGDLRTGDILIMSSIPIQSVIDENLLLNTLIKYDISEIGEIIKGNIDISDDDMVFLTFVNIKSDYSNIIEGGIMYNKDISRYRKGNIFINFIYDLIYNISYFLKSFNNEKIKDIGNKLQNINSQSLKDVHHKIKNNFKDIVLGNKKINLQNIDKKSLTITFIVFIVVLLVLVSVVISQQGNIKEKSMTISILEDVEDTLNRAETLMLYDKNTAREILLDARKKIDSITYIGQYKNDISFKSKKIDDLISKIDNIIFIETSQTLYADLSNARENAIARGLIPILNNVLAFDYNAIYTILMDQVKINKVVIDDLDEAMIGTYFYELNKPVILTKKSTLIEINGTEPQIIKTEDDKYKVAVDIDTFNRNLYLLDPTENQIWKYTRKNTVYSKPLPYNTNANLKTAVSMTIDGFIWVLTNEGNILKLSRGVQQEFNHVKFNPSLKKPTKIRTVQESNKLYILDSDDKSIVLIGKNKGDYIQKYKFKDLSEPIKDIVLDKSETFLYALTDNKIYKIDLRK